MLAATHEAGDEGGQRVRRERTGRQVAPVLVVVVTVVRVDTGQLDTALETVVINTGHGLKTLDAVSDRVGAVATIAPSYDAFVASGIL